MPLPPELLSAHHRRITRLSLAGGSIMERAFRRLPDLDERRIRLLELLADDQLRGVASEAGAASSAIVALQLGTRTESAFDVGEIDYRGPFTMAWAKLLATGGDIEQARAAGVARAAAVGRDTVISSARSSAAASAPEGMRWRRVLDPDPCQWCVQVAQQTYASAESANFGHDRCGCIALPIDN